MEKKLKEIVFFLQIDLICENLVYFNMKRWVKKCFVNGASFTIKNCGIQLEDLITTTVGKKKQLSLAVAVNNELVQKSKWKSKVIKEGDVIEIVQPFLEDNLIMSKKRWTNYWREKICVTTHYGNVTLP